MKNVLFLSGLLFITIAVSAQSPISWTFSAKKLGANSFEVHMTASIQNTWHLYSQEQPDDAIAIPTTFTITNNPLLSLNGKIKEIGKMEKYKDAQLGISAHQYSDKVDFVQVVNLKGNVKTNFSGNVEYQTCDDKKCLPPKTVNFSIALK
jgi:thiol:disulfide interchange protein DsbD